jgi:sugar lactone lactonase YvrE
MRTRRVLVTSALAALFAAAPLATAAAEPFPDVIPIPNGWLPEGIATGTGTSIYAGSRANGAVWLGDLRTGEGDVLVEGAAGRVAVGIKVDRGLLFVSGGGTGDAYIYDATTGAEVAVYNFTDDPAFINDVTVTQDAAYFTNSQAAVIYRVDLVDGVPQPGFTAIPLGGEWQQVAGFNANGIASTPDGSTLFVINSTTGILYTVDPVTGEAVAVDTGGADLTQGDGILLRGKTLYVVRNRSNVVVELKLSPDFSTATQVDSLTDPDFDVPTTIAAHGSRLYVVNARFTTPPTPTTEYDIVRIDGE